MGFPRNAKILFLAGTGRYPLEFLLNKRRIVRRIAPKFCIPSGASIVHLGTEHRLGQVTPRSFGVIESILVDASELFFSDIFFSSPSQ